MLFSDQFFFEIFEKMVIFWDGDIFGDTVFIWVRNTKNVVNFNKCS